MKRSGYITSLSERLSPRALIRAANSVAVDGWSFLQAYWEALLTFDPSRIEPSGERRTRSAATAMCLAPFLKALSYRGTEQDRVDAMPHFQDKMDIADLRTALVNLGYRTEFKPGRPCDFDARLMPCLHQTTETSDVVVLLTRSAGGTQAFVDGSYRNLTAEEERRGGNAFFARPLEAKFGGGGVNRHTWSERLLRRFQPFFVQLLLISAVSNVLSIAVPLFVMTVYDQVIAQRALDALPMLLLGIALAIGGNLYLKVLRSRLLGTMAARIDYLIGTSTFAKLLRLPLGFTLRPSISSQISRLREFQGLRDLIAGPGAGTLIDFPFSIVALALIAAIGGWLVLVPLTACLVYAVACFLGERWLQVYEQAQNNSATALFNHVTDTTMHHESIKREGAETVWLHRFRLMSADAATCASNLQDRAAAVEAFGQFLNSASAMAVLLFGTLMVIDGSITVGVLIGTMALTWRVLGPTQQLFQTLGRLKRLRQSVQSLDQMLAMTDEYDTSIPNVSRPPRDGRITLNRISLRYGKDIDPALTNVNLNIPAGTMVAITGSNGAGKSSILSLVQGLYQPQSGVLTIDDVDIRQLPSRMLRRAIASVPQKTDLFYGTIAQNLRLGDAFATDDALRKAADAAGILSSILALPRQFETTIGDSNTHNLPPSLARQIVIARALVRKAPILLIDEPEAMLDEDGSTAIQKMLQRLRGQRTILFTSHRPSYIRLADFAVFVRRGTIEFGGAPDGAIAKLLGTAKHGKAA